MKVNWTVQDENNSKYSLTLFTLDPDKDIPDLMGHSLLICRLEMAGRFLFSRKRIINDEGFW